MNNFGFYSTKIVKNRRIDFDSMHNCDLKPGNSRQAYISDEDRNMGKATMTIPLAKRQKPRKVVLTCCHFFTNYVTEKH